MTQKHNRVKNARAAAHIFIVLVLSLCFTTAPAGPLMAQQYVGSEQCESCHSEAYKAWKGSHHYQAMLPAVAENVLGDFSGREFTYYGVTSRFFTRDGKFFVETDNAEGRLETFEIAYTFGFFPLQQYLIAFSDGRYQALNIVWDSRSKEEGGQRWVHLYPDDPVAHDDIVHWTGAFQNWNSRCAVCHSTGLDRNYSAASDTYQTTWREVNVACEACHGPASGHIEWTRSDRSSEGAGFSFSLQDKGAFGPAPGSGNPTFSRLDGQRPQTQIETCAACHARRSELQPMEPGKRFADQFRLSLLEPGVYHPDGQILEEVYVYGSFLQSKMHGAGVVCTNCHEPHSNAVIADNNTLCTQCHVANVFDRPEHHHHQPSSPGAACVSCHMPVETYMVVDDRHDHSFRIPDPRLTLERGIPNTCNQCHEDRDPQWALDAMQSWGLSTSVRAAHANILGDAWSGQQAALPGLLQLATSGSTPDIVRASALLATQNYPSQQGLGVLQQQLGSDSPLIRAAAVQSMDWLPLAQRYALLRDLVTDSELSVRLAVARQLAGIPADQLPGASATELQALFREYLASLKFNADMPEDLMNLALFHAANNNPQDAEKAYRSALKLAPSFLPALLNLADLYRANGMDKQAEPLLRQAVGQLPESAPAQYALGLLLIRQQRLPESITHLQTAAAADSSDYRYVYVYGVALWESGQRAQAIAVLEAGLQRLPGNRELISALGSYYQEMGESSKLEALMEQYPPQQP